MQKTKIKVLNFLSLNEKSNFITISRKHRFASGLSLSSQGKNIFPRQNECLSIEVMACCNVEAMTTSQNNTQMDTWNPTYCSAPYTISDDF